MSHEVKVSQFTALMIEQARRAGLPTAVIAEAVLKGDVLPFEKKGLAGDKYESLFAYSKEHGELLYEAVQDGYRMTFNTRNGLKNWLVQRFELDGERDFEVGEGFIHGLHLNNEQLEALQRALAVNWVFVHTNPLPDGIVEVDLSIRALQAN